MRVAALGKGRIAKKIAYEPYLIQQGLLYRTQKGRMATELAYKHLGIAYSGDKNIDAQEDSAE